MRINEIQSDIGKKIKLKTTAKLFIPVCTGYTKALTQTKFAGLMYFLEANDMHNYDVLLEDPKDQKAKRTWEEQNQATTNVMTHAPKDMTEWRRSNPDWLIAKKSVGNFFDTSNFAAFKGLFTSEEWLERKIAYADLAKIGVETVTDELLKEKFTRIQLSANARLATQVAKWKTNPRNKDVPDREVEEHCKDVLTDILFMKGRQKGVGTEWFVLYEHSLAEQKEHVEEWGWLLGYYGNNFKHVQLAFKPEISDVNDGIFAKRDRDKDRSPTKDRSATSAPMDIPQRTAPPSPKKKQSPARVHYSPPADDVRVTALELLLNSNTGVELARMAVTDSAGADKSLHTMTDFIQERLSAVAPSLEPRKVSPVSTPSIRSPSSSVSSPQSGHTNPKNNDEHKKPFAARKLNELSDAEASVEEGVHLKPMNLNLPPLSSTSPGSSPLPSLKRVPSRTTMFAPSPPDSPLRASGDIVSSTPMLVRAGGKK